MKHRTVNDYFKQQWPRLILFAAFTLGVSFFAPLKNFQLKWLIDSKSKQEALGYMGLVFAITFSSWFFERLSRRSFTRIACGAVEQVRQRILEQVLHRTVAQYNAEGDAAYLSLLTTDLRTLYDDYYMSLFSIVFWGGIMLCALAMYLYISPVMLLAILLVTIPPLVLPRRMNERLKATRDAFSLQMADYTQQLKELLGGFEIIRSFLREDAYAALHQKAARKARESELDYQQSLNAMVTNTSLISNLIFPVVMLVGLFLAFDGRLTMGTVSTAASMANFVITPCHQIAQCWAKVKSSQGIRQRLEAAMAEPQAAEQGEPIGHIDSIQCETVRFAYPNTAEPVLKDASLTVDAAQKVALVGESGCGKSTLAKLLFQYYPDYSGDILFNGRQVRTLDRTALYRRVGYIAQTAYLFHDTIRNNICLHEDFPDEQLAHAIAAAGLTDWVASLPDGLDTVISENGKNLSGGQRQRIGIARLALRSYDLIIADEITASLDPDTSQQVMENLIAMPCMVVAITHDVAGSFMHQFDKVYRVEHGVVRVA
ncbi:ABC transporter ATP-binding protein [Faecalibacterium prausnitzii]|uniref:ABC transporter ATP-binding protein n=1 Tax=Faecalibacterium prausnitzii TaxID=853 RepID=A0A329UAN4_9FIRM|nr:ABC transporter ATP-binding protein [Faecalibacterium prausnitzii]RAW58144.1 ABC transporter ATP-binding protein [Faecalibacterium prausnitzii]